MRKLLSIIALALLLSSCAIYTIGQGKANIVVPEDINEPETRYSKIKEREAEWESLKDEETTPDLPYNYVVSNESTTIETELNSVKSVLIPLEKDADIDKVISSIRSLDLDFAFLTGEEDDIISFIEKAGYNAILFDEGAILYKAALKKYDKDSASFILNDQKNIEIAIVNNYTALPEDSSKMEDYLLSLDESRSELENISIEENVSLFAVSSSKPSSTDWVPFTYYDYRTNYISDESEFFNDNGYTDVYRATHYSAETDPGITRHSGDIYERLDFVYIKNAIAINSATLSVAGMSNNILYSEILI